MRYPRMSGANPAIRTPKRSVPAVNISTEGYDYQCGTCPKCQRNDRHHFRIYGGWAQSDCGFYDESPRWKLDY